MVKFGAQLQAHLVKGWERHYVDYARLKALIPKRKDKKGKAKHGKQRENSSSSKSGAKATKKVKGAPHADSMRKPLLSPSGRGSGSGSGRGGGSASAPARMNEMSPLPASPAPSVQALRASDEFEAQLRAEIHKMSSFFVR